LSHGADGGALAQPARATNRKVARDTPAAPRPPEGIAGPPSPPTTGMRRAHPGATARPDPRGAERGRCWR